MYIRPVKVKKDGKDHVYWSLVESYRTSRGPRQRTVAYLSGVDEEGRLGIHAAGEKRRFYQKKLFDKVEPEWIETDPKRVRVKNVRDFGSYWLGLELMKRIGLDSYLSGVFVPDGAKIEWSEMVKVLVLSRLSSPCSELHIAEHLFRTSALEYLLGIPCFRVDDNRLYRAMDHLLPHKESLEVFLKEQLGNMFKLDFNLILYDITSTYFEGEANKNPLAQRGYSRDSRPDCKQVCIALCVSREGLPFGYEVFAGNRSDVTTLQDIVETMERRYGRVNCIWCMDRGMICEENMEFLRQGDRRYIVGTPRSMLKRFEHDLLTEDWETVREGLEMKRCASPEGSEVFILCRSHERREKEKAIHERFEKRIETDLIKIEEKCQKKKYRLVDIAKQVGRLLGRNGRAAGLFDVDVVQRQDGRAKVVWKKLEHWREWARLTEGCYLLRSNVTNWNSQELWEAYIQLTEAEKAFRIQKSDLRIRPVWHQKEERVRAHILVCFLAYVLWTTLAQLCKRTGLGNEPRRIFEEIGRIKSVDVILPTKSGKELCLSCVAEPSEYQKILLQRLSLTLPKRLKIHKM